MSLDQCMLANGFTEAEIDGLTGGRDLTEQQFVEEMTKAQAKMQEKVRIAKIQMLRVDSAMKKLNSHPDGAGRALMSMLAFDKTGKSGTLSIDLMSDQYARMVFSDMSEMMEKLMPTMKNGWQADDTFRKSLVDEIYGKNTGDADAAKFANNYRDALEKLRVLHNKLGGDIKKNNNWFLPQSHNGMKMRSVSRQTWVDDLLKDNVLDLKNMTNKYTDKPFRSKDELRPFLNNMYDSVVTNGASKMDLEAAQFKDMRVAKGVSTKQRFLQFKSGDSYLTYQKKYGEDDIYSSMVTDIQGLARETAMLKQFGPNPGQTFNFLLAKAKVLDPKMANRATFNVITRAENTWKDLTGELAGNGGRLQGFFEGMRNVMTFKLGSASISALGDQGTLAMTAKINDIPVFKNAMNYLTNLSDGKEKQFLLQSGVNADFVIDVSSGMNRYTDAGKSSFFAKLSDRFLRVSGLNAMTEAGRASIQLSALGHLANVEKTAYKDLSTGNLRMLNESGITEADWKVISASKKHAIKGARYLDMRELPMELQMKVGNMMDVLAYRAIPAPDAEVRAILRQGTEAGTVVGELVRGGGQFKSFGVSVLLYHGNLAMALGPKTGGAYAAGMFVMTSMMGAIAVQAKQLVAGKEPMDTSDPRFMMSAILQGGGLGIYGDFLFSDQTRYGNSIFATLAGPSASALESLVMKTFIGNTQQAIKDAVEGNPEAIDALIVDMPRDMVDEFRKNLPTQLWFSKLAFEKLLYQTTQQLIDEDYINKLHKREAKLQNEEGRGYLFQPVQVN